MESLPIAVFYTICRIFRWFNNLYTSSFPAEIRCNKHKVYAFMRKRTRDLHIQTKAILTLVGASMLTVPIRCPCKHLKDLIMILLAVRKWPKYHQHLFLFPSMGSCFFFALCIVFVSFYVSFFCHFFVSYYFGCVCFVFWYFVLRFFSFLFLLFHNLFLFLP